MFWSIGLKCIQVSSSNIHRYNFWLYFLFYFIIICILLKVFILFSRNCSFMMAYNAYIPASYIYTLYTFINRYILVKSMYI